jgi:hypothetical protein
LIIVPFVLGGLDGACARNQTVLEAACAGAPEAVRNVVQFRPYYMTNNAPNKDERFILDLTNISLPIPSICPFLIASVSYVSRLS